jgi:hypothetical protein
LQRWSSLEASRNPFATVVMAHLTAQETRHDPAACQTRKLWLTRRLNKLGYDRQQVLVLGKLPQRFGVVPPDLALRVRGLTGPQMLFLLDVAYSAATLDEVAAAVEVLAVQAGNGSQSLP